MSAFDPKRTSSLEDQLGKLREFCGLKAIEFCPRQNYYSKRGWGMRNLVLATTCAIGVNAVPALAADLPAKMPVKAPVIAPAPYFSWTGCYVGGHVGGGWGRKEFTDEFFTPSSGVAPASFPAADTSGWVAGGQIGCNYQFTNNWVVGAEGSGSWANIKGSSDPFFAGKAVFSAQTEWIASATARLGYAIDRWFIYSKGGAAWAGDKYQMPGTFAGAPFNYTGSETRSGWTIGGGVEWAFYQNWSAKVEYAYYDFGTRSLILVDPGPVGGLTGPDPSSIKQRIQTVAFGINYHFWTGTPLSGSRY
jgi:outer membrane immunogenic protein